MYEHFVLPALLYIQAHLIAASIIGAGVLIVLTMVLVNSQRDAKVRKASKKIKREYPAKEAPALESLSQTLGVNFNHLWDLREDHNSIDYQSHWGHERDYFAHALRNCRDFAEGSAWFIELADGRRAIVIGLGNGYNVVYRDLFIPGPGSRKTQILVEGPTELLDYKENPVHVWCQRLDAMATNYKLTDGHIVMSTA